MASSLILNKRINTTVAKAKALRKYVEPLITKSKTDSTHSRRMVFSMLQNKEAVAELFRDVASKIGDRPGGYTRIIKTGNRLGDAAEMCMMELVDFNELMVKEPKAGAKKAKTTRRGRPKKAAEGSNASGTPESSSESGSAE
jgi:large subunit ribosomal protein L17